MNIQMKHSLVWGGLLIMIGLLVTGETFFYLGPWVWISGLALAGAGVLGFYSTDKSENWLALVAYVLEAIAVLVALLTLKLIPAPLIPTYVLLAIALPFLIKYFHGERKKWGLLAPVYVLVAVAGMVPLIISGALQGIMIAVFVLFVVSIPFFVVYFRDRSMWWALIPGVATAVVGGALLISDQSVRYLVPVILIAAGITLTTRIANQRGNHD